VVLWAHPSLPSNRHVNRFDRFCRAHERDQQIDIQTEHATSSEATVTSQPLLQCNLRSMSVNPQRLYFRRHHGTDKNTSTHSSKMFVFETDYSLNLVHWFRYLLHSLSEAILQITYIKSKFRKWATHLELLLLLIVFSTCTVWDLVILGLWADSWDSTTPVPSPISHGRRTKASMTTGNFWHPSFLNIFTNHHFLSLVTPGVATKCRLFPLNIS